MFDNNEAIEKVSIDIFELINKLIDHYKKQEDQLAIEALAPVLTTTGTLSLCQTIGSKNTIILLKGLISKIEEGNFSALTSPNSGYRYQQ